VVFHCGWVEMDHRFRQIRHYLPKKLHRSQVSQTFIHQKLIVSGKKLEAFPTTPKGKFDPVGKLTPFDNKITLE
jgi:hypothetical protein